MTRTIAILFFLCCANARAQTSDSLRAPRDSVLQRARQLVQDGRDADGRKLIDSLLKETTPDSPIYAEALYWRAALAATAADAERDYRRLLIDAPLSPRGEDALLQLAQLEQARGDRRSAADHLQRFLLTYGKSAARPRVALSLVRLLFDMGPQQQARACEALRMGREAIPVENAELRNQLDFYAPRCMGEIAVAVAPSADTASPAADPATDTTRRAEPLPIAKSERADKAQKEEKPARVEKNEPTSYYSVQVAAYDSVEPAKRMVKSLSARGLEARVDGTARPFRVRIGKYGTRAAAVKSAQSLKAQGHPGFVTLVSGK